MGYWVEHHNIENNMADSVDTKLLSVGRTYEENNMANSVDPMLLSVGRIYQETTWLTA